MPRGGKREGAGRPGKPLPRLLLEIDGVTSLRLARLAEAAGITPQQYLQDAIRALDEARDGGLVASRDSDAPAT